MYNEIIWRATEPEDMAFNTRFRVDHVDHDKIELIIKWLQNNGDNGCYLAYPELQGWEDDAKADIEGYEAVVREIALQSRYSETTIGGDYYNNGEGAACSLIDAVLDSKNN